MCKRQEKRFCIFGHHKYKKSILKLSARNHKEAKKLFETIEQYKHKYYFLGYVEYEFYKILQDKHFVSTEPLAYFEAFAKKKKLSYKNLKANKFLRYYPHFYSEKTPHKALDFKSYEEGFKRIKAAIAKGQSYQVNFTQEFFLHTEIEGFMLFKLLLERQNTPYAMYFKNEFKEILSFSPELFFATKKHKNSVRILTKPMKGTIKKGKNKQEDKHNAELLQKDLKNRSENVMIVDLLRNDLAHIAKAKSIKVSKLFNIESYKTLLQMTSSIEGTLRKNVGFFEIFKALFPCGSITGAPKLETIELIQSLEQRDRGVYCGALGLIHKDKSVFNVGIRTLCKKAGKKAFSYGVGSGIVWDSVLNEEFRELELKSSFLKHSVKRGNVGQDSLDQSNAKKDMANARMGDFYLFETMLGFKDRVLFFKEHVERIIKSAKHFGFEYENLKSAFAKVLEAKRDFKGFSGDLSEINTKLFSGNYGFFDVWENLEIKNAFFENQSFTTIFCDDLDSLAKKSKIKSEQNFGHNTDIMYQDSKNAVFKQLASHNMDLENPFLNNPAYDNLSMKSANYVVSQSQKTSHNPQILQKLQNLQALQTLQNLNKNAYILRLILCQNGKYDFEILPLLPLVSTTLRLSKILSIKDDLTFHKTSLNALYATQSILWKEDKCFDVAFFNTKKELCEGTRSNIVVQKGGKYYTPKLECGLLAGIYRQFLLQIGAIQECVLSLEDLQNADKIYCLNSVRGLVRVELE